MAASRMGGSIAVFIGGVFSMTGAVGTCPKTLLPFFAGSAADVMVDGMAGACSLIWLIVGKAVCFAKGFNGASSFNGVFFRASAAGVLAAVAAAGVGAGAAGAGAAGAGGEGKVGLGGAAAVVAAGTAAEGAGTAAFGVATAGGDAAAARTGGADGAGSAALGLG